MAKLVDIFLQPSKVFAAERERPTFVLPALVLVGLTVAFTLVYFFRVDAGWYADHMFDASAASMKAKDLAKAKAMMPGTHVMGALGAVSGTLMLAIVLAVMGLYYWVASKITGRDLRYAHGVSLAAWSSLPVALGTLVALVGALTMAPTTGIESLMLTHVDPLLVSIPAGQPGARLARSADLLSIWGVFLGALGWRVFTRAPWLQSIVVAVIPLAVTYALLALLPG